MADFENEIVYLSDEEYSRFEEAMLNPTPPTKAIHDACKLLRKLYHESGSGGGLTPMNRNIPMRLYTLACATLALSACSSTDVQTGLLVGQSLAQNALTVYEASPRKNPTIAAVATDLVNAEPALVGSYSSTATTKANALALAVTAVQQIAADDPKPAIVQAAPLVLAGLAAAQGGTAASPAQLVAVGTMVTTWLLDKALQS